jgi:hypothetical protein
MVDIDVPDHALWPRVPYGYALSTRTYHVDGKPKVTVSLLKGEPHEVAEAQIEAARRGEFPDCRINYGTIDVEFYGSGTAVLDLMRDLKARAGLT